MNYSNQKKSFRYFTVVCFESRSEYSIHLYDILCWKWERCNGLTVSIELISKRGKSCSIERSCYYYTWHRCMLFGKETHVCIGISTRWDVSKTKEKAATNIVNCNHFLLSRKTFSSRGRMRCIRREPFMWVATIEKQSSTTNDNNE